MRMVADSRINELCLFPSDGVVMPGGQYPLRILEARYQAMIKRCLINEIGFGVCLVEVAGKAGAPASPYPCGTLIKIVDWGTDESGLLVVLTEGVQKFRTRKYTEAASGLLVGDVDLEPLEISTVVPDNFQHLVELLQRAFNRIGRLVNWCEADFTDALWVGSRLVELLPMSSAERHASMSVSDPVERLRLLAKIVCDNNIQHL